jgi:hypothetical protein
MAASPAWKVYNPEGEYIGCTKHASDAAALVVLRGEGGTVKHGHNLVVWREGFEEFSAGESYDQASEVMHNRLQECQIKNYAKNYRVSVETARAIVEAR